MSSLEKISLKSIAHSGLHTKIICLILFSSNLTSNSMPGKITKFIGLLEIALYSLISNLLWFVIAHNPTLFSWIFSMNFSASITLDAPSPFYIFVYVNVDLFFSFLPFSPPRVIHILIFKVHIFYALYSSVASFIIPSCPLNNYHSIFLFLLYIISIY